MQVVIVTEIYGRTAAIDQMVDRFAGQSCGVTVVDPYSGAVQRFIDEEEAYSSFMDLCGHDRYANLVQETISALEGPLFVIGFSVGAAAAWRALESQGVDKIAHFIGFYPGQIRHHLEVEPACPVTLIFPLEENHFSVSAVMNELAEKEQVHCHQVSDLHGFMNPCSAHYTEFTARDFYNRLGDLEVSSQPDLFRGKLSN